MLTSFDKNIRNLIINIGQIFYELKQEHPEKWLQLHYPSNKHLVGSYDGYEDHDFVDLHITEAEPLLVELKERAKLLLRLRLRIDNKQFDISEPIQCVDRGEYSEKEIKTILIVLNQVNHAYLETIEELNHTYLVNQIYDLVRIEDFGLLAIENHYRERPFPTQVLLKKLENLLKNITKNKSEENKLERTLGLYDLYKLENPIEGYIEHLINYITRKLYFKKFKASFPKLLEKREILERELFELPQLTYEVGYDTTYGEYSRFYEKLPNLRYEQHLPEQLEQLFLYYEGLDEELIMSVSYYLIYNSELENQEISKFDYESHIWMSDLLDFYFFDKINAIGDFLIEILLKKLHVFSDNLSKNLENLAQKYSQFSFPDDASIIRFLIKKYKYIINADTIKIKILDGIKFPKSITNLFIKCLIQILEKRLAIINGNILDYIEYDSVDLYSVSSDEVDYFNKKNKTNFNKQNTISKIKKQISSNKISDAIIYLKDFNRKFPISNLEKNIIDIEARCNILNNEMLHGVLNEEQIERRSAKIRFDLLTMLDDLL